MEPLIPAVLRHNVTGGAKRSGLQCSSVWLGHRHVLDWDQPSGPNMAWKKSAHLSYMVPFKYIYWSTIFADVWPCLGPTSVRKLREVKLAENLWHSTCIFFLADWHVACPAVVFSAWSLSWVQLLILGGAVLWRHTLMTISISFIADIMILAIVSYPHYWYPGSPLWLGAHWPPNLEGRNTAKKSLSIFP